MDFLNSNDSIDSFILPKNLENLGIFSSEKTNKTSWPGSLKALSSPDSIGEKSIWRPREMKTMPILIPKVEFSKTEEKKIGVIEHFNFEKNFGFLRVISNSNSPST